MGLRIRLRHNAPEIRAAAKEASTRATEAMVSGTEEGIRLVRSEVIRLIATKTTMSREVAESITESEFRTLGGGGRGEVSFTKPPKWIYPKTKKALAFTIDGRKIVRRRVRGSRPYKLIRMGGVSSTDEVRRLYQREVRRAEDV